MDGRLIIDNERVSTGAKVISENPATLEAVGEAFLASDDDCRRAIKAAKKALPDWRSLSAREKMHIFHRARKRLLERSGEIARIITVEKGSPLVESLAVEILTALEALDHYGRKLPKITKPEKVSLHVPLFVHKKSTYHFSPLSPTLIISPWNFPFSIPFCDVLSALAAGNTVVLRPSTTTPFCALALGEVFLDAGLPPGVLNVVTCRVPQAEAMILNPEIQTVMFTGSVPTGKRIMELASRNLTKIVLELGGKDPMIVLKDADLDRASRGAVWAAFMNCGQSCASVERLYVSREVEAEFLERVLEHTRRLRVGNPLEEGVDVGPMATLSQLELVEEHVREAREKGAEVLLGGDRIKGLPGYFYQPTVLTGVNHSMKVMSEETFGPVLPVMSFSEPEEAVTLANDSPYGLTASVWTKNKKQACWMAERLEVGTVTVNDHMFSFSEPKAIWGGIKQTGLGRSHGSYGIRHLVNIKFLSFDFLKRTSQLWWFPYSPPRPKIIEKSLRLLHHERFRERLKALLSFLPFWSTVRGGTSLKNFVGFGARLFRRSRDKS